MIKKVKLGSKLTEWRTSTRRPCQHVTYANFIGTMPKSTVDANVKAMRYTDCPKCQLKDLIK